MIIPDVNMLIYAHNSTSPNHKAAKEWLENTISGPEKVGIPWVVILGFIRILSNPRLGSNPQNPITLSEITQNLLRFPSVSIITPGMRHLDIMMKLFRETQATGKLTTDIHLAALAMEHKAVLISNDTDFARFSNLKWHNPLKD